MFIDACENLPENAYEKPVCARDAEESPLGREVPDRIIDNADLARSKGLSICQDTGLALVWLTIGSEALLGQGLRIMIGKGPRSEEMKALLPKYGAVYMSAIGGAAASISESIKKCELVAYEDLGAEAIYRLEVENFYAVVTYDAVGGDLFSEGEKIYKR